MNYKYLRGAMRVSFYIMGSLMLIIVCFGLVIYGFIYISFQLFENYVVGVAAFFVLFLYCFLTVCLYRMCLDEVDE